MIKASQTHTDLGPGWSTGQSRMEEVKEIFMASEKKAALRPFGMKDKLGYMFGDFGNDFTFSRPCS